jgi:hypothetical protein
MNKVGPRPRRRRQRPGDRGLGERADLGLGQEAVGQHRDRHHQRRDADEAEDGRPADIGAGLREARIDAGALDADEHEHRDQHRVAHLHQQRLVAFEQARGPVAREGRAAEREQHEDQRDQQRRDLGDGDDLVDRGGLLDAAQDHEVERPDADQRGRDGRDGVAAFVGRKELAERGADQHPVEHVAQHAADPVAEGRQKAHVVAEAGLGVGEHAGVDVGALFGERLEDAGQHVDPCAGDGPGDDGAERAGRGPEPGRQVEDAGP